MMDRPRRLTPNGARAAACAVAVILSLAYPLDTLRAQTSSPPGSTTAVTDAQLKADVERRLSAAKLGSLKVTADAGTVTLTGRLPSAGAKQDAIDAARRASGLMFVVSEITIQRADSDEALALDVGEAIHQSMFYTVYDEVIGIVRNGAVTLRGRVVAELTVTRLAEAVAHIRGVQVVNNQIRELPTSPLDDQIRVDIASAIYRDPMFLHLAMGKTPPIHVIVENRQVTLVGRVRSDSEKQWAEILARQVLGSAGVENKLQVDK